MTPATTWLGVEDITLHGLSRSQDKRCDPTHEGHGEQGGGLGAGWGAAPCLVGTVLVLPREEVLPAVAAQHRTRSRSLSWACGRGRSSNLYVACVPRTK